LSEVLPSSPSPFICSHETGHTLQYDIRQ